MKQSSELFNRYELKYILSEEQKKQFLNRSQKHLDLDEHAKTNNGSYPVSSLYFESSDRKVYFDAKNKTPFRKKLRLRSYFDKRSQSEQAYFELKQKHQRQTYKRRVLLSSEQLERLLSKEGCFMENSEPQSVTMLEVAQYIKQYELKPSIHISYNRIALVGRQESDLRITIDNNLKTRKYKAPEADSTSLLDSQYAIMELKVLQSVPLWLNQILNELEIRQVKFSKYCDSVEKLHTAAS